ncbi:hypothetical protein SCHPADRAFT_705102 [Schizopora paradoxa]|uniref:Uncharacterized protein n=1 Tax=Schizopora paradoxa TaxID=27342 RepID=A0A0H2R2J8_9AGAM|nr:hypothetical protein SCHPADRAFT_705102 [Schizopora paradoxa]
MSDENSWPATGTIVASPDSTRRRKAKRCGVLRIFQSMSTLGFIYRFLIYPSNDRLRVFDIKSLT